MKLTVLLPGFAWLTRNHGLVASGSLICGVAALWVSWMIGTASWWSAVLVNAGTALLLFAPLLLAGRYIERRFDQVQTTQTAIEDRQQTTTASIESLAKQVSETRAELRRSREELSDAVTERLASRRADDAAVVAQLTDAASHDAVFAALERATQLNLISPSGCRVALGTTDVCVRFLSPEAQDRFQAEPDPSDDVELSLEGIDGDRIRSLWWSKDQTAEDFLVALGEALQSSGHYPGDKAFRAADVFHNLQQLLEVSLSAAARGASTSLNGAVQYFPPQWMLTDQRLASIGTPGYSIPLGRLREAWPPHMAEKSWIDRDCFDDAYATARLLFEAGRFDVKPPGYPDNPPF